MTPVFIIALPLMLVVAVGFAGSTRRLGFWWTILLSLLITPIGGFLVAALSGARRPKRPKPTPALVEAARAAEAAVTAAAVAAARAAAARPTPPDSTVAAHIVASSAVPPAAVPPVPSPISARS